MLQIAFILVGIIAGLVGGVVGLTGGIIIIPILVVFFHFSQRSAQGTTLALLIPPITFLGAWVYYKHGQVNVGAAVLLAIGFAIGNYSGAIINENLPTVAVSKIFGLFLAAAAVKLLFFM